MKPWARDTKMGTVPPGGLSPFSLDQADEAAYLRGILPPDLLASLDNPTIGAKKIAWAVKGKTGKAIRKGVIRKARSGDPEALRELLSRFGISCPCASVSVSRKMNDECRRRP